MTLKSWQRVAIAGLLIFSAGMVDISLTIINAGDIISGFSQLAVVVGVTIMAYAAYTIEKIRDQIEKEKGPLLFSEEKRLVLNAVGAALFIVAGFLIYSPPDWLLLEGESGRELEPYVRAFGWVMSITGLAFMHYAKRRKSKG